jgi:hypothetical protein
VVNVAFSKERAEQILQCVSEGQPIPPAGDEWTTDDVLLLAGVTLLAGREALPVPGAGQTVTPELFEARMASLRADAFAVIAQYAELAGCVLHGTYNERFGPQLEGVLRVLNDRPQIVFTSGVKPRPAHTGAQK